MMRLTLSLAAAALALAGCKTEPVHYHTLLGAPAPMTSAVASAPFVIEVLPVGIPAQLDQPQMVVHDGNGSLAILDLERWAGPLADEIRGSLSAAIAQRTGAQDVAGLARPAGKPLLRIKVQVRRLDAWPGSRVQLEADWSIGVADEEGNARLACHGQFEQPAPGGYPQLAQAQQAAVAALAARIAADARAWAGSRAAACSAS